MAFGSLENAYLPNMHKRTFLLLFFFSSPVLALHLYRLQIRSVPWVTPTTYRAPSYVRDFFFTVIFLTQDPVPNGWGGCPTPTPFINPRHPWDAMTTNITHDHEKSRPCLSNQD